jgi:hypothetical protein
MPTLALPGLRTAYQWASDTSSPNQSIKCIYREDIRMSTCWTPTKDDVYFSLQS